jgi:predicted nucleic acid-binding protein
VAGYLLDTTVIIDVLRDNRARIALLESLLRAGNTLGCCAINVAEVYAGMRATEARSTDELLESLEYHDITRQIARRAGRLKHDGARRGRTLTLADAVIAAVALDAGLTLITDNVRDFRIAGLSLYPLA